VERRAQLPGAQLHARRHARGRRRDDLPQQLQGAGIAGLATVASAAYPDSTQFDPKSHYHDPKATPETPRWFLVDVAFERKLKRLIPLEEIKQHTDELGEGFALTAKGSRLSVFPVTAAQWKLLLSLE